MKEKMKNNIILILTVVFLIPSINISFEGEDPKSFTNFILKDYNGKNY